MKKASKILLGILVAIVILFITAAIFVHVILAKSSTNEAMQRNAEEFLVEAIDYAYSTEGRLPSRDELHPGVHYDDPNMIMCQGWEFYYLIENDSVYALKYTDRESIVHTWRSDERIRH